MEIKIDINTTTKELIYINFPLELDTKYNIVKYYKIDWNKIINKTFLDITKLRIPIVLLRNKNNFSIQEKNLTMCADLDSIKYEENDIILLLNLGISKKKFKYQTQKEDYTYETNFNEHNLFVLEKNITNNNNNDDDDNDNESVSTNSLDINDIFNNNDDIDSEKNLYLTMLIYKKIEPIVNFNESLNNIIDNTLNTEFKYYIEINEIIKLIDSKLKTGNSKFPNLMKNKIKLTLLNIYTRIYDYLELNNLKALNIYKSESYNLGKNKINSNNEDFYGYVYNNTDEFINKLIENYEESNDFFIEIIPDFYIYSGFDDLPHIYIKDCLCLLNSESKYTNNLDLKNNWISKINKFYKYLKLFFKKYLSLNYLLLYLLVMICLCAQIIAPIYFILFSYYTNNFNCPNQSYTINKFFAVIFFIIMYSQLFNALSELYMLYDKFDKTYLIKIRVFYYLGLLSNILIIFILPFFTYVLFMENNRIIDLILNCVSGVFLVNLDNELVSYFCDKEYLKIFCKDQLLLSYLNNGYREKNTNKNKYSLYNILNSLDITLFLIIIWLSYYLFKCL